jgi:hypothetical protein
LASFVAAAASSPEAREAARTARVQAGMNAFRDRASGPYTAEGRTISVQPQFLMNGGFGHDLHAELPKLAANAHPPVNLANVQIGRGTPEQVARATQLLIDSGKLPPGTDKDLATRIRRMQWDYGVGFDCAGYSQQAAAAARGVDRGALFQTSISDAISFEKLHKVDVTKARAGDMFVLNPPDNEPVGHKTLVYSHATVTTEAARKEIASASAAEISQFGSGGPVHRYELDSSWGAGPEGGDFGGYRREPALYNEATKMWAWREPGRAAFQVSDRPYDHPINGAYRPNSEGR